MFNGLWPAFDEAEVPIGSITNGVHAPTWVAREVFELAEAHGADVDSDDADALLGRGRQDPGTRDLGGASGSCAQRLVAGRPPAAAQVVARSAAPPRPSSAGSTPSSTPTC